jgi:hypothetical protein
MPQPIIWLHDDSLSSQDPALQANPQAPAIFVFDEPFLREAGLSFKRLLFIYECAIEAIEGRDAEIRRGEVVPEVLDFARRHQTDEIHVSTSGSPRFQQYLAELRRHISVRLHNQPTLVEWEAAAPQRFSRFWRKIEDQALRPYGDGPAELRQ